MSGSSTEEIVSAGHPAGRQSEGGTTMIYPERGVTIETRAVVSDATSVDYLVSRDGEAVEFSLGRVEPSQRAD